MTETSGWVDSAFKKSSFDSEADRIRDTLQAHIAASPHRQHRGLARELVICTLMIERLQGQSVEEALLRSVAAYRRSRKTTAAMLKKCGSHARALLRFGAVDGKSLSTFAGGLEGDDAQVIATLDEMLMQVNTREVLSARASKLGGASGGRPAKEAMAVLKALVDLSERASEGDRDAQTEFRLISAFFRTTSHPDPRSWRDEAEPEQRLTA